MRSLFISLLSDFCHPPSASGRTPTGFGGGSSSSSSTSSSSKRKKGSNNHFLERDISTVSDPKLLMNNMVHMIILIEEFLFYARVSMPDLAAQDAGVDVSGTSINSERGVILSRSRNMTLMPRPVQVEDLPIVCQLLEIMDNFFGGKLLTTSDFSTLQGVDCKSSVRFSTLAIFLLLWFACTDYDFRIVLFPKQKSHEWVVMMCCGHTPPEARQLFSAKLFPPAFVSLFSVLFCLLRFSCPPKIRLFAGFSKITVLISVSCCFVSLFLAVFVSPVHRSGSTPRARGAKISARWFFACICPSDTTVHGCSHWHHGQQGPGLAAFAAL